MKKKTIVSLIVLALIGAAGYSYQAYKADAAKKAVVAPQAMPVDVMSVAEEDFYPSLSFVAKIEAKDKVDVRARVMGFLTKRLFTEGDFVKKDQLLFEIEKDQFIASLNNAEANLAKAKANEENAAAQFKRAKNLFKTKDVSEAVLDQRQAEYSTSKALVKQAQAELDIAKLNLNYTDVIAPLSGRIGAANYSEGSLIGPESGSLVTIVSTDPMYAVFSVSENQLLQMKDFLVNNGEERLKISFNLSNGTTYSEPGKMDFVDIALDEQMNTMKMRISFPNPENRLIAGQYGRAAISFADPQKAILLPSEVILRDLVGPYVYVINSKKMLEQRRIKEGLELASGETIIDSGLEIGEMVLTSNLQIAANLKNVPVQPIIKTHDKKNDVAVKGE